MAKESKPRGNGLKPFSLHSAEAGSGAAFAVVTATDDADAGFARGLLPRSEVDPERAARHYLERALESDEAPDFIAVATEASPAQFKLIGTETVPLTGTRTVKFRQAYSDIPVYGSLVTVELDDSNDLVSIISALGEPVGVSPLCKISATQAAKAVAAKPPYTKKLEGIAPRLSFYYDAAKSKWRLVFIFEDVAASLDSKEAGRTKGPRLSPRYFDYVVDAHSGIVVAELPRTPSMASKSVTANDARNASRTIWVEPQKGVTVLFDSTRNVTTFDFAFGDPDIDPAGLPGQIVPAPFSPDAVSAHANAAEVADFLRTTLRRNNLDNRGGAMNSSINCVVASESPGANQWFNAYWNGDQMVYGQVNNGGALISLAAALDVVAHEMFHGITDNSARLEYATQSGALNESYSDIFGVIIANQGQADPRRWDWRLGVGFGRQGGPLRDMSKPGDYGQPDHMRDFKVLPNTRRGDWGGVHTNSGIHNKAAYSILTAADARGLIFTPAEVAAMFYVALTQYLSRTSQFADSRRAVLSATRSLFRRDRPAVLARRIAAVEAAYTAVGIT